MFSLRPIKISNVVFRYIISFSLQFLILSAFAESPTQWSVGYDVPDPWTVALFHFDENSGTSALNEIAYGNDGALLGNTSWASGKFGSGLDFEGGPDDRVEVAWYAETQLTDFTLEMWVKPNTYQTGKSEQQCLFSCIYNYELWWDPQTQKVRVYFMDTDTMQQCKVESRGMLAYNEWHHISAVWFNNTKRLYLYINGEVDYGATLLGKEPYHDGTSSSYIGGANVPGYGFDGTIDEVRISGMPRYPEPAEPEPEMFGAPLSITQNESEVIIEWGALPDISYIVEWISSLTDTTWTSIEPAITGEYIMVSYTDTDSAPNRFYRVKADYTITHQIVTPADDLKAIILAAPANTSIELTAGTFYVNSDIIIQNKDNLTIKGQGDSTKIKIAADVGIAFDIYKNVNNLTISDLFFEGTLPLLAATRAVGSHYGTIQTRNITITRVRVENTAIGISVGGGPFGDYAGATVTDNIVRFTHGTESGWGYGIHNDGARDVLFARNYVEYSTRHGIYQARGYNNIIIRDNFVLNHDYEGVQQYHTHPMVGAIDVARSNHVILENNIVTNGHCPGIIILVDEIYGWPADDIRVINNKVIGAHSYGFWSNTGEIYQAIGNSVVKHPGNTKAAYYFAEYPSGVPTGGSFLAPDARWENLDFMTATGGGGDLFAIKNGTLDMITPYYWNYETCPTNWSNTVGITAIEDALGVDENRVYIAQNNTLNEVNPSDWSSVSSTWNGLQYITSNEDYAFVIKYGNLYRVTPGTFDYFQGPDTYYNPYAMCSWGGDVYIMDYTDYYRVDPITLVRTLLEY
jgi:Concanavalin A-like lectin/glucanases superfamily